MARVTDGSFHYSLLEDYVQSFIKFRAPHLCMVFSLYISVCHCVCSTIGISVLLKELFFAALMCRKKKRFIMKSDEKCSMPCNIFSGPQKSCWKSNKKDGRAGFHQLEKEGFREFGDFNPLPKAAYSHPRAR